MHQSLLPKKGDGLQRRILGAPFTYAVLATFIGYLRCCSAWPDLIQIPPIDCGSPNPASPPWRGLNVPSQMPLGGYYNGKSSGALAYCEMPPLLFSGYGQSCKTWAYAEVPPSSYLHDYSIRSHDQQFWLRWVWWCSTFFGDTTTRLQCVWHSSKQQQHDNSDNDPIRDFQRKVNNYTREGVYTRQGNDDRRERLQRDWRTRRSTDQHSTRKSKQRRDRWRYICSTTT